MKRASLKDVAKEAGISPSAVSFILNGRGEEMRISNTLQKKVKRIADKLGYMPNQVAVSLRTGQSRLIGLVVESISGHFFGILARHIEEQAERAGYKLLYSSTENKGQRGVEILRMFSQHQVDGFLITPAKGMEKEIRALAKEKKPLVLIDSYFPSESISHVAVDNYKGERMGMDHLFERGYENIAFVTVDLPLVQMRERTRAFRESLESRKFKKTDEQILEVPFHSTSEEVCSYVRKFLQSRKSTDAVFFSTNYLGIPGLDCIQQEGFQMPHEMAMICFDDHDLFRLFPRGITAIRQPIEEIAETAFTLLMKQIKGENYKKDSVQVKLPPRLITRGST